MDLVVVDLVLVVVLDGCGGGNSTLMMYLGQCGAEANACDSIWLPRNFKKVKMKIEKIKMKIYLVTKKLQESKKENRENRNKDMFSYQEIARK